MEAWEKRLRALGDKPKSLGSSDGHFVPNPDAFVSPPDGSVFHPDGCTTIFVPFIAVAKNLCCIFAAIKTEKYKCYGNSEYSQDKSQ
ncbi:hypothetical protein Barb4_04512 [Bacteroidales bacterium Barb4]|nr:hypothetical protein Barb4_04512 [Bacteroidales bacterium Barb4]